MINFTALLSKLNRQSLSSHFGFIVASLGIFLVALGMRVWQINSLPYPVFDEVFFPVYTEEYLKGKPTWEGHPPLSKYLIMWGILIWGHNEFGYRLPTAIFGALIPVLLIGITYRLTGQKLLSLLVGCLALTDGLLLVESRFGLINCFLVALGLAGQLSLLTGLQQTGKYRHLLLANSGLLMSASASIKWNGLGFLLTVYVLSTLVLVVSTLFPKQINKLGIIAEINKVPAWAYISYFFAIPAIFYIGQCIPHLMLNNGGIADPIASFIALQKHIIWWHTSDSVTGTDSMKLSHPYCSPWYSWAVMARPIGYYFKAEGDIFYDVHALGNPILWWLATLSILILTGVGLKVLDGTIAYVLIGYSANYLPWMLPSRCLFVYHYMSALCFSLIALALVLWYLWQRQTLPKIIAGICWLAIVMSWWYFSPIWYGVPISTQSFYQRMWFMPNQFGWFNWI
ncbi:MAG: phospholipid carrier-dependent glycosyltransferase [Pseudanabaenaceae cyanobacterium]